MQRASMKVVVRVIAWGALLGALTLCITANTCSGDQYREMGQKMGEQVQQSGIPQSYMYVADVETKQYWPNQEKYEKAIPDSRRVYILDQETVDGFKGYEPGPL